MATRPADLIVVDQFILNSDTTTPHWPNFSPPLTAAPLAFLRRRGVRPECSGGSG